MYYKYADDTPDDSSHLQSNVLSHRTANINAISSSYISTQRTTDNTAFCLSYVTAIRSPNVASKLPALWLAQQSTIYDTDVTAIVTTYDASKYAPDDDADHATNESTQ